MIDIPSVIDFVYKSKSFDDNVRKCLRSQTSNPLFANNKVLVLDSFVIIHHGIFHQSYRIIQRTQLVWLYPKRVTRTLNFIIPLGTDYAVVVCYHDAIGKTFSTELPVSSEAQSTVLLEKISSVAPWSLVGWNEYLNSSWRNRPIELFSLKESRLREYVRAARESLRGIGQ